MLTDEPKPFYECNFRQLYLIHSQLPCTIHEGRHEVLCLIILMKRGLGETHLRYLQKYFFDFAINELSMQSCSDTFGSQIPGCEPSW